MIDWEAVAFVVVVSVFVGLPALWWGLYHTDVLSPAVPIAAAPVRRMASADISEIERALSVTLPAACVRFLTSREEGLDVAIDNESVRDDARSIIEATLEYRQGFAGLPAWPAAWVYIGEEADACAHALDCATGVCLRLDKGNPLRTPLERHEDFGAFLRQRRANADA